MNRNSRIFIAGHRGMVGSAIEENLRVKGYTNLITKTREELDLKDFQAVGRFFEEEKPEYVFLAAAKVGGITANNIYRADFIYDNLMIQTNIIHHSYLNRVKKLLFMGSTCIYPKNVPQPIKEEDLLTGPLEYTNEPYAIAKIAGIKMCESYNIQYGTNYISVMPTNLYGPKDNFDLECSHVLPALIRKMHLGKAIEENDWELIREDLNRRPIRGIDGSSSNSEILALLESCGIYTEGPVGFEKVRVEIWGSGKPLREFLWSEEMADACVFLMESRNFRDIVLTGQEGKPSPEIRNTHINIGTGKDISISSLAETVKNIIQFKGELFFNSNKPDGAPRKLIDVSKLNALGWKYKVELDEGIFRLYTWYKASVNELSSIEK